MDAFNDGDVPRMLAALAEDVEVYASPEMANAGDYSGHDGFVAWITAWTDAWEEVTAEVTDNIPSGTATSSPRSTRRDAAAEGSR